jgi:hypothetical protein
MNGFVGITQIGSVSLVITPVFILEKMACLTNLVITATSGTPDEN